MPVSLFETASEIFDALSASSNSHSDLNHQIRLVAARLGATRALLMTRDIAAGEPHIAASFGLGVSDYRRLESKVGSSVLRRVLDTGKPIQLTDIREDEAFRVLKIEDPGSLFAVPVRQGDEMLGVFAAEFPPDAVLETGDQTKLLALVATVFAQVLRLERAVANERQKLIEENSHLKYELREKYDFSHIIGNSSAIRRVYEQVTQVARSNATVLLRGESGTGKEMIANAIHYNSLRSKRPFIRVNCAALPETLIEAELFGHEKGAFTGADRSRKGRFELAEGGTLFLDEIGDLPPQTQVKLLRVLQEREFERLGGTETIKTNIRLITATNKNLEELIGTGEFREDLYYRLNVFTIYLPPLRERRPDILLLAEHFLEKYEREHGKHIRRISTPAIDMLMSYHFPGNVRELENAIERAVLVCDSNVIHGHHLPPTLQTAEVSGTETRLTLASAVAAFERDLIQDALKSTGGNVARAAKQLDTTERILGYKIRKYKIDVKRFRTFANKQAETAV